MLRAQPNHKLWWYISCITIFSLLLTACVAPSQQEAAPAADEPIELTWLDVCAPITTPITDMLIAEFEADHPNVKVTVECAQGDYAEGIYARPPPATCRMSCSQRISSPYPLWRMGCC
ncbi:MAG: hypothetical protein R3E79_14565 [Caldilineaceae bacterium]